MIFSSFLLAVLLAAVGTSKAGAVAPNVVAGSATADGDPSEWNTSTISGTDFFIYGCPVGNGTTTGCVTSGQNPRVSWYMRYDCPTRTLYVLALPLNGNTILTTGTQFIKGYPTAGSILIDTGGGGLTLAFHYLFQSGSVAYGWEASSGPIPPGTYSLTMQATTIGSISSTNTDITTILPGCTTASLLGSVRGKATQRAVQVRWNTVNELGALGFNVSRSNKRHGLYVRLNAALIPPMHPGLPVGAKYKLKDKTAPAGKNFYKVDVMGSGGVLESKVVRVRVTTGYLFLK